MTILLYNKTNVKNKDCFFAIHLTWIYHDNNFINLKLVEFIIIIECFLKLFMLSPVQNSEHKQKHKRFYRLPINYIQLFGSWERVSLADGGGQSHTGDKWECQSKVKHGLKAAALRRVLHVRWAHVYLARLSWWLSWLGSCTRLPPGSPVPRPCRWRWLELVAGGWGMKEGGRHKGRGARGRDGGWRKEELGSGGGGGDSDTLVNEHVHNAQ